MSIAETTEEALSVEQFETIKGGETETLRATPLSASPIGVDKEAKVIRGYVVAERGPFRTGRGEFTDESLQSIVKLMKLAPGGVPVNYGHQADAGTADTLDAFLGVAMNPRIDGDKVRADLHINPVAFLTGTPGVSRGDALMLRAETAPSSFGSSLVLKTDKMYRLDDRGRRKTDRLGNELPPVWSPTAIAGSDVVAVGDAVKGGFLAAESYTSGDPEADAEASGMGDDSAVAALTAALDALDAAFAPFDQETCETLFELYLDERFGAEEEEAPESEVPADGQLAFNPNQPRDAHGRFATGGGGGGGGGGGSTGAPRRRRSSVIFKFGGFSVRRNRDGRWKVGLNIGLAGDEQRETPLAAAIPKKGDPCPWKADVEPAVDDDELLRLRNRNRKRKLGLA